MRAIPARLGGDIAALGSGRPFLSSSALFVDTLGNEADTP